MSDPGAVDSISFLSIHWNKERKGKEKVIYVSIFYCLFSALCYMSRIWHVLSFSLQLPTYFARITRERRHRERVAPQPSRLDQVHGLLRLTRLKVYLSSREDSEREGTKQKKTSKSVLLQITNTCKCITFKCKILVWQNTRNLQFENTKISPIGADFMF